MKKPYRIKYRVRGQWLWRTIKGVIGDEIIFSRRDERGLGYEALFRAFVTDKDDIIYVPLDAEVIFPAERQVSLGQDMSREAGQQIQRA